MRRIALALLTGCGGTFDQGQATVFLGMDPYGGAYNPDLRGCRLNEQTGGTYPSGLLVEYDGQGRMTSWLRDDDLGIPHLIESEWDGPCKVHEYVELPNGNSSNEDWECDERGWPVSSHRAATEMSNPTDPIDTTWTNTYDGELLAMTVVSDGFTYGYDWADGRLAQQTVTDAVSTTTYTYVDGWITELMQPNGYAITYVYEDGRLVSSASGDVHTEWVYTDKKWPAQRLYYDSSGNEQPTELDFDCP